VSEKSDKKVTKVRKKQDVVKMYQERKGRSIEKEKDQESWHKFWEKDENVNSKKLMKQGGLRRPKSFKYDAEVEAEITQREADQRAEYEAKAQLNSDIQSEAVEHDIEDESGDTDNTPSRSSGSNNRR
jgi:hypothetical protein